jgi:phage terminase large subunit
MIAQFNIFAKQRAAWDKLNDLTTNEVMYGGGARGGKSYLGCGWVIIQALSKPGSKWIVLREELTKLKDTTLLSFFQVANELSARAEFVFKGDNGAGTVTFHNGSIVFFRELKYIPSDPLFDRLGSYDLTGAFIDEAQQIHPQAINVLRGRFSTLSGPGWQTVPKMLFTCNPAKNWIYTDFYKPFVDKRLPAWRAFIPSLATDNPFVSQDYIDNLRRSDQVTVQRLLLGNFEYDDDPTVLMAYDAIQDVFRNTHVPAGPRYLTADIARYGDDQTVIFVWAGWRGRLASVLTKKNTAEVAAEIRRLCLAYQIPLSHVVVDEDGVGGGVLDQLPGAKGFVNNARPLKIKGQPQNYENLKTQCYYRLAELRVNPAAIYLDGLSPDQQQRLTEELGQVKSRDADKDSVLRIIPKDQVKQALGRSPDYSDSVMMREYFELASNYQGLL